VWRSQVVIQDVRVGVPDLLQRRSVKAEEVS
jgi:hypothetical protein